MQFAEYTYVRNRFFYGNAGDTAANTAAAADTLNAHSEEECEKLLAEMITEMKAEIAAEKERLKAAPKAG